MPLAAPPALLLPLLGLAAAAVADCPSSTWIQFQDSCYIFLQEAIKVESIEDVRNQCTDHVPYKRKYLSDNHILISALVIASTVILTVLGAIIWFLYKKHSDSRFTVFSTAPQSPYNEDCVLVVGEENEYPVQFE
uniref:CD302 molecule n=1 Tax=Rhinopithecus bieti TaxID=61621 RepID=A0A2K6MJP8_RHIBE